MCLFWSSSEEKGVYGMKRLMMICGVMVCALAFCGTAGAFELNSITFNDDYGPDTGYVAYIQPYDAENQFHSPPGQRIEQYGNPGDAPLGPWSEGDSFSLVYGKAFGGGEVQAWAAQNYVVTFWWQGNVGDYVPVNGPGGDIYIYQPDDGTRCLGILYQGQWKMFDAGTNGLSDVRGDDFWWDLSNAGVAEGDTIDAIAWWANALGHPGLLIEKKFPDGHKEQYAGPATLDMDGDGSNEALTFLGGGSVAGWHDPFYMGIGNAALVLPPSEVWVAPPPAGDDGNPGTAASPFATIQKGIDSVADAGTVHIAPGTYVEIGQIVIASDLTIIGDASDKPVIMTDQDTGSSGDSKGWWLVNAGVNLNIQDLVLDGSGYNVFQGIRAWGTGTMNNCDVMNMSHSTYIGWGLVFMDANWTVANSTFINFQRIGVMAYGGVTNGIITGNTFVGKGIGNHLDYGIELGGGAAATITGNHISNCRGVADSDGSTSAGILMTTYYDGGTAGTVTGNTLTGNTTGVAVGYDGSDTTTAVINNNDISGNYSEGVDSTGPLVNAENNWWGSAHGPDDTVSGSVEMPAGGGGTPVADMLNAAPVGLLGDAVSDDVDYYPWLGSPSGSNTLWLNVPDESQFVRPGETVDVQVNVRNLTQAIFGAQAFMTYDEAMLGSAALANGEGNWEVLEGSTAAAGEIDLLTGNYVDASDADATLTDLSFTAGGSEGTTQVTFRPDADIKETILANTAAQAVYPTKVNSQTITIDDTPPTDVQIAADPSTWTNADNVELTFSATDALAGIDYYELTVDGGAPFAATSPYDLDVSGLADGQPPVTVTAYDMAGNSASAGLNLQLDKTDPSIAIDSATQNAGATDLLGGDTALIGTVTIVVSASDATSGLDGIPTVTVTPDGGTAEDISSTGVDNTDGTFTYTYEVTTGTPNGIATINASVSDLAVNSSATSATFNINKNQVAVTVELEGLNPGVGGMARVVTLVATGGAARSWDVTLNFAQGNDTASATLTDVPASTTGLSAKTDWNLRSKVALTLDGSGQGTASFTDPDDLLGGDLNDTNSVTILDWAVLRQHWYTYDEEADINGDGQVSMSDYNILKGNWFAEGDDE